MIVILSAFHRIYTNKRLRRFDDLFVERVWGNLLFLNDFFLPFIVDDRVFIDGSCLLKTKYILLGKKLIWTNELSSILRINIIKPKLIWLLHHVIFVSSIQRDVIAELASHNIWVNHWKVLRVEFNVIRHIDLIILRQLTIGVLEILTLTD
jgi:hypothetical protein